MYRPVVVASLALALALAGCAGYRTKRAETALSRGDRERALKIWESLAKRDHPEAQYQAGVMRSTGQGVKRDPDRGSAWLRAAARQGHVAAQAKLGQMYVSGQVDPGDDPDAERWMRAAAENGSVTTRYGLAVRYLNGEIVEENRDEALRWFRAAASTWQGIHIRLEKDGLLRRVAELGLAEAQHSLGNKYLQGQGLPQSLAEAAKWQYLAANQGHVDSQLAIAWAYGMGQGIPKDISESARWFHRAAEAGNSEAQYQYGLLLARGLGVRKDFVKAHMWFNLAAAQGHGKARVKRDTESRRLTLGQRTQAELLALQWFDDFAHREAEASDPAPPVVAAAQGGKD